MTQVIGLDYTSIRLYLNVPVAQLRFSIYLKLDIIVSDQPHFSSEAPKRSKTSGQRDLM